MSSIFITKFPNQLEKCFNEIENYIDNSPNKTNYMKCLSLFRFVPKISYKDITDFRFIVLENPFENAFDKDFQPQFEESGFIDYEFRNFDTLNSFKNIPNGTSTITISYVTRPDLFYKSHYGHENVMVVQKNNKAIYTYYIEPHGRYYMNVYDSLYSELKNSFFWNDYEKAMTNKKEFEKFIGSNSILFPIFASKLKFMFEELYRIESVYRKQLIVKNLFMEEIKKNYPNHKIVEFERTYFVLQQSDELGFCTSTKFVVRLIHQAFNQCIRLQSFIGKKVCKNVNDKKFIKVLDLILEGIHKSNLFQDSSSSKLCKKGGFLCRMNILMLVSDIMTFYNTKNYILGNNYEINTYDYNTGFATKQIMSGMQMKNYCLSIENDLQLQEIAEKCIGNLSMIIYEYMDKK